MWNKPSVTIAEVQPQEVADGQRYETGPMQIGGGAPALTIVEFSDFQCPFCSRLAQSLDRLQTRGKIPIRVIFRNYPLRRIHPFAEAAAAGAECAAEQGRFKEWHDWLFAHQDSIGKLPWSAVARRTGIVDSAAFLTCQRSLRVADRLRSDSVEAARLRITGTPLVMIGRWMFMGAPPDSTIEKYVRRAWAEAGERQSATR